MQHRGRRDRQFRRRPGGRRRFQIGEILAKNRFLEPQLAADAKPSECRFDRARLVSEWQADTLAGLADPADAVEEIHMPRAAAKFAVGDTPEADFLLHPRDIADRRILDPMQLPGGNPPLLMLGPRSQQFRRPEQASDVIGAKRRTRHCTHPNLPRFVIFQSRRL